MDTLRVRSFFRIPFSRLDSHNRPGLSAVFRFSPFEDCYIRIDDQELTEANSSLHIRNRVLSEATI
jgi:hypothetical protein